MMYGNTYIVDCGDPGLPPNSDRQGDRFLFTDMVQYACNDGYYQSGGDNNLTCLNTGQWDGALPNCTGITIVLLMFGTSILL